MRSAQVMVNRDGILTIKGERKFEVRCCPAEAVHHRV